MVCTHRGSLASHAARRAALPYDASADVTGVAVFGVWDAVCALLAGSRAAMLPVGALRGGGVTLARAMLAARVTRAMLTPSLAVLLLAADAAGAAGVGLPAKTNADAMWEDRRPGRGRGVLATLRVIVLCGEVAPTSLVRALLAALIAPGAKLANLYSLSEAHDVALEPDLAAAIAAPVRAGIPCDPAPLSGAPISVPCGLPYAHVALLILDANGVQVTESNTAGWLHLGGAGLAAGYLVRAMGGWLEFGP